MRRPRIIGITIIVSVSLVVAGIYIYAEVFRFRTEHLLAKLKTFQVEETAATAVLGLRSDYLSNVTDRTSCSTEDCQFSIGLTEWELLMRLTSHYSWAERPMYYLVRGLRFFGLRFNYFVADLLVDHEKLRSLRVWLVPMSYIEYGSSHQRGFLSSLSVGARTDGNFRRWIDRPQVYVHPYLIVWKPSACTGCSGAIMADFTWQASRKEVEQALDFNLSCITRVRDCRTPEEYLPSASKVLEEDKAKNLVNTWGNMPCESRMARILVRDSDFVSIVRIRTVKPGGDFLIVDYELIKRLKGKNVRLNNISHQKELAAAVDPGSRRPQHLLQPGALRLVFLSEMLGQPTSNSDCAVMALTRQTTSATLEGIADDRSGVLGDE